ncbi:hypothetical protein MUK42_35819 [Musa troglodytarum]|uniref:Uncharacterized protein n=1 Tax=Musa troglodytarum TaxID=320322 RepID=A0A9E7EE24_9LILI|nr:hypothetical protein MUK42_35819 [Musa troglodytarum]
MGETEKGEAVEVNPVTESPFSRQYHKLLERRKKLPVWGHRSKFLDALAKRQVVVVAAPPGSGKSTQDRFLNSSLRLATQVKGSRLPAPNLVVW